MVTTSMVAIHDLGTLLMRLFNHFAFSKSICNADLIVVALLLTFLLLYVKFVHETFGFLTF